MLNVLAILDEEDKGSVEMIRRALQPIDEFRAAASARRSGGPSEPEESEPSVPEAVANAPSSPPVSEPGPVAVDPARSSTPS